VASGGISPSTIILRLRNTIIGASGTEGCDTGFGPPGLTSPGTNLDADGSCQLGGAGDQSGFDPLLDILRDNGGPTLTHALKPGSPAIDAGNSGPACLTVASQAIVAEQAIPTDQRGFPRPRDGNNDGTARCDIGAYEVPAAVTASTEWYFAEGHTGPGFDEYLTIQNPNSVQAVVTITYFLTGLSTVEGVGRNQAVSARVDTTHNGGLVVERPILFTYNGTIPGYHTAMGFTR
jgi:hypothetical protein